MMNLQLFQRCFLALLITLQAVQLARAQEQPVNPPPSALAPPPAPNFPAGNPAATPAESVPVVQPPDTGLVASELTPEWISKQIESLEKDETLDELVKNQTIQAYRTGLDSLEKIRSYQERTVRNRESLPKIPAIAESYQKELEQLPEAYPLEVTNQSAIDQLEAAVTQAEVQLREFETQRNRADQNNQKRPNERKQLIELQTSLPTRRKEIQDKLAAAADPTISPLVAKATNIQHQIQLKFLEAEEEAIKEELNRFDVEKNNRLNMLDLELWTRKVALQKKKLESLQQILTNRKKEENQDKLMELQQESERTFPVLQSHIKEIQDYTKQSGELVDEIAGLLSQKNTVKELIDTISDNQQDTLNKEEIQNGNSEAFALSLLRQLYELPDINSYREQIEQHNARMSEATFQLIDLRTKKRKLIDLDVAVENSLSQVRQELETEDLGILELGLKNNLKKLLTQKRETIESLTETNDKYLEELTELIGLQATLVKTVDDYRTYIKKKIFWIRSDKTIGWNNMAEMLDANPLPIGRKDLFSIVENLSNDLKSSKLLYAICGLMWFLLLLMRYQASRELAQIAQQVRKASYNQIVPTLRAILLTLIISAPGPALVLFLGWRLNSGPSVKAMQIGFAEVLLRMGTIYALLEFFRQLCRRHGVIDAHFNGPNVVSTRFRRELTASMLVLMPIFFVVGLCNQLTTDQNRLPLERISFCLGMLLASYSAYRVFHPNSAVMREFFLLKQAAVISRTRLFWYPFIIATPLILSLMAWFGYYYTATQLGWRFLLTLLLLAGVLFIWALELRWYRMAQRWFKMYILRERRRMPVEETQTLEGQRMKLETEGNIKEEDREKQTLKFINYSVIFPLIIGLGIIWIDVLPAASYLDEIPIWYTHIQREVEGADGVATMRTVRDAITPFNLIMAGFAVFMTVFLTRNMPGMFDFILLQRVGIDASLRYAITSVIGYLITFIGISYGFSELGFRWEQIQWLAAALTFGLSFGLQEIFANFISGLIILFERPIRIGDIVTIEGVTGVVSRIRIRASTITDWDRKEFLVPNKELVTGRVLNWTLSDTMNRLQIPVGVAYGTDTDKVRVILMEILQNDTEILKDPAPVVTFEQFGDSTLNFNIRAFLSKLDNRLETIHRLHTNIHKKFMQEEIEIAFPQQDLHIRTVPPGWQVMPAGSENKNEKSEQPEKEFANGNGSAQQN